MPPAQRCPYPPSKASRIAAPATERTWTIAPECRGDMLVIAEVAKIPMFSANDSIAAVIAGNFQPVFSSEGVK